MLQRATLEPCGAPMRPCPLPSTPADRPPHTSGLPRTLYLCPELGGVASTGGMQAHAHLVGAFAEVLGDRLTVAIPAARIDPGAAPDAARMLAFAPDAQDRGLPGRLLAQARHPSLPDRVTMRASRHGRAAVAAMLRAGEVDLVVVDHFDALALIDPAWALACGVPLLYVAHNDEAGLARDVATCTARAGLGASAWPRALAWRAEALRTRGHEERLLRAARLAVFLSRHDRDAFDARLPGLRARSHLPVSASWTGRAPARPPVGDRVRADPPYVVFGANAAFAPNLEAIRWLACELAPALAQAALGVSIRVTGIEARRVPAHWRAPNVAYAGFLSQEAYRRTLDDAAAFVCPVHHGSGVKMKVLEALGRGLPVLAAEASWRGLAEAPERLCLPRDATVAARRVQAALADPQGLAAATGAVCTQIARTVAGQPSIASLIAEATAAA